MKIIGGLEGGPGACSPEKMLKSGPLLKQELEYKQTSLNHFSSFSNREYKNNLFFFFYFNLFLTKALNYIYIEACFHVKCLLNPRKYKGWGVDALEKSLRGT